MNEETKVRYNVGDAIAELKKLNRALGETADKTVEALGDKASEGLDKFQDGLSDISPLAGNVVGKMRSLVAAAGPMGAVFGVAAASIGAVVSNLIDLPNLLADSQAGLEAFQDGVERQFKIVEGFGDVQDAADQAANKRALKAISLRQRDVAQEQVRISNLKALQQEELQSTLSLIRDKERALEKSIRKRKALEGELNAGQNGARVDQVERGSRSQGQAVQNLAAEAQKEALKGNVDLAEQLRDRAQQLTDELGGHVFFQKEVDRASQAITENLTKQVAAEARLQASLEAELATATKIADEKVRALKATTDEQRFLAGQRKLLGAERKDITSRETIRQLDDDANTAANRVSAEQGKIKAVFDLGRRSVSEGIVDSFKQTFGGLSNKGFRDAGLGARDEAFSAVERIVKTLGKDGVTGQDVIDITPDIKTLNQLLTGLKVAQERGTLKGVDSDIANIQNLQSSFDAIAKAAEAFQKADRSLTTPIKTGSQGINIEATGVLGTAASKLDLAASKLLGVPAAPGAAGAAAGAPGAPKPGGLAPAQNITVNATVKGGIIDAETTRAITEIIRKELRKNTSPKPN